MDTICHSARVIKITDKQTVRVTFTHVRGGDASLFVAMNPLTGDWLQEHMHNGIRTAYYGTKTEAVRLANNIVKKSAEKDLACKVDIQRRKILP